MAFFIGSGLPSGVSLVANLALDEVRAVVIPEAVTGLVFCFEVELGLTIVLAMQEGLMATAKAGVIAMLASTGAPAVVATLVSIKAQSKLSLITGLPSMPI